MSWEIRTLGSVADLCLGKMLDQKKNKGVPRPYLANINVRWGSFDLSDLREMRFEDKELDRYGLRDGDIVMCEGGEPGRCAIWRGQSPGMMFQKALHRIRPNPSVDTGYLYYALLLKGRSGGMDSYFTGATIKHLPGEQLAKIEVLLPPLETQRRIAGILGAYDDLIEVNRRRIAVLEEMARGLFTEWFIRLRFPRHEDVAIEGTSDGPLPAGWSLGTLGDVCQIIRSGSTPSRKLSEYWDDGILDWFTTGELNDGFLFSSKEQVSSKALEDGKVRVFPAGTVFIALYGATIGKLGISKNNCSSNQAALGIVPDGARMGRWQLFHTLQNLRSWFVSIGQGAAQQNISKEKVASAPVVLPPHTIAEQFDRMVSPIWELRAILEEQALGLSAARDLLLPRLISGQLSVAQAERELEIA